MSEANCRLPHAVSTTSFSTKGSLATSKSVSLLLRRDQGEMAVL